MRGKKGDITLLEGTWALPPRPSVKNNVKVTTFKIVIRTVLKWAPDSFYFLIDFEAHGLERKFMGVESKEFSVNEFRRGGLRGKHSVGTWDLRSISKLA